MKMLTKEHGFVRVDQTGENVWNLGASLNQGWEKVTDGSFVSSTYFDLAGMSMEEKTLFFEAAGVQEILAPTPFFGTPGDSIVIADLMTSSPLTNDEAVLFTIGGNMAGSQANISFQETVYARVNTWVVTLDTGTWGGMTLSTSNQLGSMQPTASDRVYSYKVLLIGTPNRSSRIDLTASRHMLQAKAKEESDHEYMMRLMRSYQLQQEPDVD